MKCVAKVLILFVSSIVVAQAAMTTLGHLDDQPDCYDSHEINDFPHDTTWKYEPNDLNPSGSLHRTSELRQDDPYPYRISLGGVENRLSDIASIVREINKKIPKPPKSIK